MRQRVHLHPTGPVFGLKEIKAFACAALLDLSVTWVWAAILLDHAVRALHLGITFRRGRWLSARSG